MLRTVKSYQPPAVDFGKRRKTKTIPDQSMTIRQIVERYVKGVPVDIVQRDPVFMDQNEHDFEKLSRMDFAEKSELANAIAAEAQQKKEEANEAVRRTREERAQQAADAKKGPPAAPGIVNP